ncbi:hypothetical protein scyTo_0024602 [Scyliorhinus torazame]|uniref:Uncharacterized protein n=1 Tax=Scyliorhinus torazame TaxID=75743 RepID=A0A401QFQ1_SCYTO|nr:hypothetical protein [Scyliorhinus torazame]
MDLRWFQVARGPVPGTNCHSCHRLRLGHFGLERVLARSSKETGLQAEPHFRYRDPSVLLQSPGRRDAEAGMLNGGSLGSRGPFQHAGRPVRRQSDERRGERGNFNGFRNVSE